MNILGITGPISWNNAAVLIKDGKLVAAAEEERFTRQKFAPRVLPVNAIKYCLSAGNLTTNDVDYISVGFDTPNAFVEKGYGVYLKHLRFYPFIKKNNYIGDPLEGIDTYFTYRREMKKLVDLFKDKKISRKIVYVPHHFAHAASTYFTSGFKEANIISLDGRGEDSSTLLATGENGRIEITDTFSVHNSLGNLYSAFTKCLGFNPHCDEGKVMGLASYGKPVYDLKNIVKITPDGYAFSRNWYYEVIRLFGKNLRKKGDPITKEHENLAASLQYTLEKVAVNLAAIMHNKTGYKNFCLAGGVSLNCDMNSKILFKDFTDDIFIQPAAHDAGSALGAALHVSSKNGDKPYFKMEHAYFGPEYSNEEIKEVLNECKIKADFYKDIEGITAEKLAKGYIVGWHQGRLEFGPRALGARSILGHPGKKGMKEKINKEVKHRECYDEKTEILTKEGWKLFKYLEGNEEVATLNPKNNELEYQKITKKTEYECKDKMVYFKNKRIDLMVTTNHKVWAKRIKNHSRGHHLKQKFRFETAINLIGKENFQIKAIDKWKGKEKKYFILPKIKKSKYDNRPQISKITMDLWLEFLGYYLSEGSFTYHNGHYGIYISQYKKSKSYKRIEKCLNKMGFCKWGYTAKSFRTYDKQLYRYLEQFGKAKDKFIPRGLLHLSERQLKILFDALMRGDGTYRPKQYKYTTISKKLADNIQELGIKLGYSVTTSKEKVRDQSRQDKYYVRLNKGSKISFVRKNQSKLVSYKGKVYCVTVPKYHILCVKRGEKIVFSGNSWRPFAPSMLAESMKDYVEDAHDSPFMILTFTVKKEKRKEIAEATHVDNTVRVQSVKKEVNPRYYRLIKEFEKETSIPVLLNTSFNDNNEPIVLTPRDAIRTFMVSGMDYLALGNYLLKKVT